MKKKMKMGGNTGKTANPTSSIKSFEKGEKMKMKKGGSVSFGMLSVKKGIDNNPKPTAADRIAGATMKKGGMVKSKKK